GVLLVIGFGALGVFPNYYTFSQELTVRHQGKVTGMLGCSTWMSMALLQSAVGESVERVGYAWGVGLAGVAPLVGFAALVLFWGPTPEASITQAKEGPQQEQIRAAQAK